MNDSTLWKRYKASFPSATGPCPDLLQLAQYCDGLADASETQKIERHLGSCPRCMELVVQTRLEASAHTPAANASTHRWLINAAAAAILVTTSVSGYKMGSTLADDMGQTAAAWLAQLPNDSAFGKEM